MKNIPLHRFKKICRLIWGGNWHITLSRKMNKSVSELEDIKNGNNEIPYEAILILKRDIGDHIYRLDCALDELESYYDR